MKSANDVKWNFEHINGHVIAFTLEPFPFASEVLIKQTAILSGSDTVIGVYGITNMQGYELAEHWNMIQPKKWRYEVIREDIKLPEPRKQETANVFNY